LGTEEGKEWTHRTCSPPSAEKTKKVCTCGHASQNDALGYEEPPRVGKKQREPPEASEPHVQKKLKGSEGKVAYAPDTYLMVKWLPMLVEEK